MLTSLAIKNYALIRDLAVEFSEGLSVITGETGAGKSILLGGLSLILGRRADTGQVYDKSKKCIVEARFEIGCYDLHVFFDKHDLDYDDELIVRREILPNGKSRAFVNDTPTNLSVLSGLSERIIDIHSQHETLQLADSSYQFRLIDAMAGNEARLIKFRGKRLQLRTLENELEILKEREAQALRDQEYNRFMYEELADPDLREGEQEELERSLEKLAHSEEIKLALSEICELSDREPFGLQEMLNLIRSQLDRIAGFSDSYSDWCRRWESLGIEARDLISEIESENEDLVHDPSELEKVEQRLQLIYSLQRKHNAGSISELLDLQNEFLSKLQDVENSSSRRQELERAISALEEELRQSATILHDKRAAALPDFVSKMEEVLGSLEMKNTRLRIELGRVEELLSNGMDTLEFLISSDRGVTFEPIRRIASGGEMSRLMLAAKYILSGYTSLPAIIFDEIDSGVSGEVSNRIADLMIRMSKGMQVITITHLPQVAAKGMQHYLVYKSDDEDQVATNIQLLNEDERLVHLAEMLGGSEVTESALAHARQLLS
jgi:DNA repair protein RecN (Recombination protein N)